MYYNPVGHAVEALKVAKGYHLANPDFEIHLALNSRTAYELADVCPWIEQVYPVDTLEVEKLGTKAPSITQISSEWDYVVVDERTVNSSLPFSSDLRAFHHRANEYFQARQWKGHKNQQSPDGYPKYVPDAKIDLIPPEEAQTFVKQYEHFGPKFSVLLAGSSLETIYPKIEWWIHLFEALSNELPESRFFVTGVKPDERRRTATLAYTSEDLERLFTECPQTVDCYDTGLWNQLALIKSSDVFIAPHTGFAFLAPCVGTPWLAVSGVRWPDYMFNQTPFYSVLPDCRSYPCWQTMKESCQKRITENQPVLCMETQQLDLKMPELIHGARLLRDHGFTYQKAVHLHREKIIASGIDRNQTFSFDNSVAI